MAKKCEHMAKLNKMAAMNSPGSSKQRMAAIQLSGRLQHCWSLDVDWGLYPAVLREVIRLQVIASLSASKLLYC